MHLSNKFYRVTEGVVKYSVYHVAPVKPAAIFIYMALYVFSLCGATLLANL